MISETGGTLQIRIGSIHGTVLAEVNLSKIVGWKEVTASVLKFESGVHDLFVVLKEGRTEIDWISFE